MRHSTRLAAIAIAAATMFGATGAYADCPGAGQTFGGGIDSNPSIQFGFNAVSINGGVDADFFDSGPKTDSDCFTAGSLSYGTGTAVSGEIVDDASTPATDDGVYVGPVTAVYGPNSTAVGNGASVFKVETYIDDHGTADPADDTSEQRLIPIADGTAVGANAHVGHDHSTAIGADAESTDDHQVTLGTENDTIRAKGVTTQKAKNRQVGPVELVTTDSEGRLATDGGSTFAVIDDNRAAIAHNRDLIDDNTARLGKAEKGIAISNALPDTWLSDRENFAIGANLGFAGGETAIGMSMIGRLDEHWSLNGKMGADTSFDEVGGSIGARYGF